LSGPAQDASTANPAAAAPHSSALTTQGFGDLCRLGLALTWPLATVALAALAALLVYLMRH
jgi:hypothetical protein